MWRTALVLCGEGLYACVEKGFIYACVEKGFRPVWRRALGLCGEGL